MKKFQKYVMAFLLGAVSLGFTSCSDDDDPVNNGTVTIAKNDMQTVTVRSCMFSDMWSTTTHA